MKIGRDSYKFQREVIEDAIPSLLDDAITWIAANLEPGDVFSESDLAQWAAENGFVAAREGER